ncbi:unnamed protein product [Polarella glacialis]|uniref:Pentatricopeptide repeat-containing protein, chloroplastic n=1 Tax=Polarella glacialis TaxID=89957 RepID=A0A813LGS7_POLGL|nr:unnamed protein product [Polarella glacialis]
MSRRDSSSRCCFISLSQNRFCHRDRTCVTRTCAKETRRRDRQGRIVRPQLPQTSHPQRHERPPFGAGPPGRVGWKKLLERALDTLGRDQESLGLEALRAAGLLLEPRDYTAAVAALGRRNWWPVALCLLADLLQRAGGSGLEPSTVTFNAAMVTLGWQQSLWLLRGLQMDTAGLEVDVISYNSCMGVAIRTMRWQTACSLAEDLRQRGLEADAFTLNTLISGCNQDLQNKSNWQRAIQLLREMELQKIPRDRITYNAAISVMASSLQWITAITLLTLGLEQQASLNFNARSFNSAIRACSSLQHDLWEQALALLQRMQRCSVPPDAVTCASLTQSLSMGGKWRQILELQTYLRKLSTALDVVAYSSVVAGLGVCLQWERALVFFECMSDESIEPDIVAYTSAVTAAGYGGQWAIALAFVDRATSQGLLADTPLYNAAIAACGSCHQWQIAQSIFLSMRGLHLTQDSVSMTSVVSAMERGRQWSFALLSLQEARQLGLQTHSFSQNAALAACSAAGRWTAALSIFENMAYLSLVPDSLMQSPLVMECEQRSLSGQESQLLGPLCNPVEQAID